MMSEPVVVLLRTTNCPLSSKVLTIWEQVVTAFKEIYPKIRIVNISSRTNINGYSSHLTLMKLASFRKLASFKCLFDNAWCPMILLVPGSVWDLAKQIRVMLWFVKEFRFSMGSS